MCGRVIQASPPDVLRLKIFDGLGDRGRDSRIKTDAYGNFPPRYNAAPGQDLWIIRRNPATGERTLDLLRWGLVPHFCEAKPKPPPINAAVETILTKSFTPGWKGEATPDHGCAWLTN
jgi:putative SOS response-associated peptidase YedK